MISKIHSLLSHLMKNMEQVVFLFLQIENSSEDQKEDILAVREHINIPYSP